MRVFGIVGWKNSGKTTLICNLIHHFTTMGLRVSTMKHTHHNIEFDQPGKDSFKHRQAGASEVLLVSRNRWALFNEIDDREPDLDALIDKLSEVDIVLIEGFKQHKHPKIQVYREEMGKPELLVNDVPDVIAIATNGKLPDTNDLPNIQLLELDDTATIAEYILKHTNG